MSKAGFSKYSELLFCMYCNNIISIYTKGGITANIWKVALIKGNPPSFPHAISVQSKVEFKRAVACLNSNGTCWKLMRRLSYHWNVFQTIVSFQAPVALHKKCHKHQFFTIKRFDSNWICYLIYFNVNNVASHIKPTVLWNFLFDLALGPEPCRIIDIMLQLNSIAAVNLKIPLTVAKIKLNYGRI